MIAKEKSALTRRELHSIAILTSQKRMELFWTALADHEVVKNRAFWIKLTTQLGIILTSKGDHLFNSFGINVIHSHATADYRYRQLPHFFASTDLRCLDGIAQFIVR